MRAVGSLVMGQAPRPEVAEVFGRLVAGPVVQRGCLDGLTRAQIAGLAPGDGDAALFTRLPSGEGVALAKAEVVRRGAAALAALRETGAAPVVVLCTGDFPDWAGPGVLMPSAVLRSLVFGVQPAGRLGVLVPLASQAAEARARWGAHGHEASVAALSPNASDAEAEAAGQTLAAADLLVFDCVSYLPATKRAVTAAAGRPGILAMTAVARVAAELAERG